MARYLVHQAPPLCDDAYFSTVAPDIFATTVGGHELRVRHTRRSRRVPWSLTCATTRASGPQLWDTSGEIRFTELAFPYIQHADAFLLVYSINDAKVRAAAIVGGARAHVTCRAQTFEQLQDWHDQLVKLVGEDAAANIEWGLVGTHVDADDLRAVSQERARRWASEHEIHVRGGGGGGEGGAARAHPPHTQHTCLFECSGATGDRVNVVFDSMVQRVRSARERARASPSEAREQARRPLDFAAGSGGGAERGYTSLSGLPLGGSRRPVLFAEAAREPEGKEVVVLTADGKPVKTGFWASIVRGSGRRLRGLGASQPPPVLPHHTQLSCGGLRR